MWQLLLVFYFLFGAGSYLLRRVLAQRIGEYNRLINAIFYLFFLLPAGLVLAFFFPHNLDVGPLNIMLLLGGSLIWPLYYIVAFRANTEVDVGIFTVINNLSPLVTLAIALSFLHESLRAPQFFGAGFLIGSGVLAASAKLGKRGASSWSGILLCLLTAFVLGVATVYERFMLTRVDFGAYLIWGWGSQIAWSVVLAGNDLKKLPLLFTKGSQTRSTLVAWAATSTLKSVAFILALKLSSASLVSAASDFLSVVVVIAAYFYLREREHMLRKWFAAFIGAVGLLLIAG